MTDFTARIARILRCEGVLLPVAGMDYRTLDQRRDDLAELIVAAAQEHYRPRVETVERLDALPVGVVIADVDCELTPPPVYVRFIDGWSLDGLKCKPGRRNLTVLWSPGAGDE